MSKLKLGMTRILLDDGTTFKVGQSLSEVKMGSLQGDFSRISAYSGTLGVHTGSNSPTVGRHNVPFAKSGRGV